MHDARVLVVDDSAAMRALFADILDQAKNVTVVGAASSASDARDQIKELRPNVVTLDVEMPGMSGIEFLEELMESNPMPVVMLSSLTQAGTETSLKAYELGAVECFPKPLKATPEQFAKTVGQLGKIVLAAANSNVKDRRPRRDTTRVVKAAEAHFEWNGHILALTASMGGIDALTQILGDFPEKCPPTVIALNAEPAVVETFIKRMDGELKCSVKAAKDATPLTSGTIHIAYDPDLHAVIEPGSPAKLRLIDRDPVDGVRPAANLLFGSIARGAIPAAGAVLTGMGKDGAKGLRLMRDAGCKTFVQDRKTAMVAEAPSAAMDMEAADKELGLDDLGAALIGCCHMG
jgi:two-component system chemotaxis response regulator CheB